MGLSCVKSHARECDGCGDCQESESYFCPICDAEVYETVFVNNEGDVLGCENCAEIKTPDEMLGDD